MAFTLPLALAVRHTLLAKPGHDIFGSNTFEPRVINCDVLHEHTSDHVAGRRMSFVLSNTAKGVSAVALQEALKAMVPPVTLQAVPGDVTKITSNSGVFLLTVSDELSAVSLIMNCHGRALTWPSDLGEGAFLRVHPNVVRKQMMIEGARVEDLLTLEANKASSWDVC